jgi:colanic acid/amylovoran biosynthesis glycosyltransferase
MRTVAIFKTAVLPSTQTFIQSQVSALQEFQPRYIGLERALCGYPLDSEPILLVKRRSLVNRVHKVVYKATGISPQFHQEVAAIEPTLLHAHFVLDALHGLPIASALNLPLIVTLHGHIPTSFGKALPWNSSDHVLYRLRLQTLWHRAALFICVSEFIRQRVLQMGYPANKLRVHYIGTDRRHFKPSNQPRDPRLILFVGRLVEKKGGTYLLRAMAAVKKDIPDARLVMIGDGPERSVLERLSRDLNLDVQFAGERSPTEVKEWLCRARVFVGPSVTASDGEAEALGMVFAEAQATGLPVVSFLHGGIPEVVRHGETGLLAPERDSHALANHILRFLHDDSFWHDCSERALKWVEERFDLAKQTRQLERIYTSVLKGEQPE